MNTFNTKDIVEKYKNGINTKTISREYHTNTYKIKEILLNNGIDIHSPNREFGPKQNRPKGWWDIKEHCEELAASCKNRSEMGKKSSAAIKSAYRHGWLDEFTEKYFDSQYHFPSLEAPIHLVYVYEVEETHSAYVGRTTDIKRRDASHRSEKSGDSLYMHCKIESLEIPQPKILEENLTAKESQISEDKWVKNYANLGWSIINKAKTGYGSGSLGTIKPIWNYETCKEAAKLCTSREDFKKKYSRAHNVSRANGWIEEFFPKLLKRKDGCFDTLEQCKEACSGFKTIMQIRNEYPFLYHKISKNKWIEEIRNFIGENEKTKLLYKTEHKRGAGLLFNTANKNIHLTAMEKEFYQIITKYGNNPIIDDKSTFGSRLMVRCDEERIIFVLLSVISWSKFSVDLKHNFNETFIKYCNMHGYRVIHIFDSEFYYHKDIIKNKIKYFLGGCKDTVFARNCEIKEIDAKKAGDFLQSNHIQGYAPSTIYLGAYCNDVLYAVMTFKNGGVNQMGWELNRFAVKNNIKCIGIGGKLFSYFIKVYNPSQIISFADKRWGIQNINVYTKIGFKMDNTTSVSYYYFDSNSKTIPELYHKLSFNKKKLSKDYGFPLTMTETEMAKELGYDRIWDCGLIKYVWKNEKTEN